MSAKVVLLTGASSGLGKKIGEKLTQEGYIVYGASRRVSLMKELEEQGASLISMDITRESEVKAAVKQVIFEQGKLDVLINCAGYGMFGMIEAVPIEDAIEEFNVNLFGVGRLTREVLPYMRKRKTGTIINISSAVAQVAIPGMGWYSASKFALEGWSDALRAEVSGFGIKVVLIEPGIYNTGFLDNALKKVKKVQHPVDYQENLDNFLDYYKKKVHNASDGQRVVNVIVKVLKTRKPKTRYLVGFDAFLLGKAKVIFSDRKLDGIFFKMK